MLSLLDCATDLDADLNTDLDHTHTYSATQAIKIFRERREKEREIVRVAGQSESGSQIFMDLPSRS